MSDIIPCVFHAKQSLRVVKQDRLPWFVAKDVCEILGISNSRDAVQSLEEDERNTLTISEGNRGNPNVNIISLSGLYALIFKSRKPEARAFRKWVTSEVLPQIMTKGYYRPERYRSYKAMPATEEWRRESLLAFLRSKAPESVTKQQINQKFRQLPLALRNETIATLIASGEIQEFIVPTEKRPATHYEIAEPQPLLIAAGTDGPDAIFIFGRKEPIMNNAVKRLRTLLDKLTEERDDLSSQIESAQSQLETINDAIDGISDRLDKLESIAEYELQNVIDAVDALESEVNQ